MANMELIEAKTSTSSSVTFSSIPQTYTDLKLVISSRTDFASTADLLFRPNGSTSNLTAKRIYATGTAVLSDNGTNALQNGTDTTANTFTNIEVYFPNYTSSNYKSFSLDGVMENNATFAYAYFLAYLWSDTAAITSLTLATNGNFVSNSTFYLYGISNVTSTTKATGGIVSSDGVYNYHMFPFSGTYTPTIAHTADVLVVAGGGSGGTYAAGGGGAGGAIAFASQSLTATPYACVVGAGAGGSIMTGNNNGQNGNNSQFGGLTAAIGGGAGAGGASETNGFNGGCGGGASGADAAIARTGGIGSQGFNGGNGNTSGPFYGGAGGGGMGSAGANTTNFTANGGAGTNTITNWGSLASVFAATGLGVGGFIAGGGGNNSLTSGSSGLGGSGGGGNGVGGAAGVQDAPVVNVVANTGSGSGGAYSTSSGNGGSGVIVIRYAI